MEVTMTIKQISVFLENKSGRINDVTKALGKAGINMHAFSMAETTDFGILRLIVSDVERAVEVLRAANFSVVQTDVICISCPSVAPGRASGIHRIHVCVCTRRQGQRGDSSDRPAGLPGGAEDRSMRCADR